jgi:hypothetical protein
MTPGEEEIDVVDVGEEKTSRHSRTNKGVHK